MVGRWSNGKLADYPPSGGKRSLHEIRIDFDHAKKIRSRRADALSNIAETYLNNNESSGSTADRYQVIVHVGTTVGAAPGRDPHIEDGPGVYPKGTWPADYVPLGQTSRRIACDSTLVTIKEDKTGEPLSIGRRSRTIPPPMRRALRVRDKGCRFPGCTNTRFVDGHHIEHWADGGESISILVDDSLPEQNYVEDCQVCCRPIILDVIVDVDGDVAVSARCENE